MSNPNRLPYATTLLVRDHCICLHVQRAARALARRFDEAFRPHLVPTFYTKLTYVVRRQSHYYGTTLLIFALFIPRKNKNKNKNKNLPAYLSMITKVFEVRKVPRAPSPSLLHKY